MNMIKSNPLVSVVTVVYNAVDEIQKTIQSIINQTYKNVEFIVIDGGSTDGTLDIIEEYRSLISFFVSEPDKGIYDAMNKGIDYANGSWICFMNAGDVFYDDKVISMVFNDEIDISEVKLVFGNTQNVYSNGLKVIKGYSCINRKSLPFDICHQSAFFESGFLKKNHYDLSYKVCADANLVHEVIKQNFDFKYVPYPISIYEASDGMSSKNLLTALKEKIRIMNVDYRTRIWWELNFKYRLRYFLMILLGQKTYNKIYSLYSRLTNV